MIIAVDGPGGAGKSTVSRGVGERLGLPHLDTGAFYRAATLAALRAGVDPDDEAAVVGVVAGSDIDFEADVTFLDGADVSAAIRGEAVTGAVSAVSALPGLRALMVDQQRRWVEKRGGAAVVEGRDIGTVVFPKAHVKVFLTARPEVRAVRRAQELPQAEVAEVSADLARRDRTDSQRATSPLRPAADAHEIDTSDLTVDDVVGRIVTLVEQTERSEWGA